jgi:hypothetical protein
VERQTVPFLSTRLSEPMPGFVKLREFIAGRRIDL